MYRSTHRNGHVAQWPGPFPDPSSAMSSPSDPIGTRCHLALRGREVLWALRLCRRGALLFLPMRMTITHLLALLALTLVVTGRSTESPAQDAQPKAKRDLFSRMAAHAEQIRNAPGRSGILAEKKLYSLLDEELIIRDFFRLAHSSVGIIAPQPVHIRTRFQ